MNEIFFEKQREKNKIHYGDVINSKTIDNFFCISSKYSFTKSALDKSSFLFVGIKGNTLTTVDEDNNVKVIADLDAGDAYRKGIHPEETDIGNVVFLIERISDDKFRYLGVADLNKVIVRRRSRNDSKGWTLHSTFYGKIRDEKDAYKFETVDNNTLETTVFVPSPEGVKKAVYTTTYERKKANRDAAIAAHGTKCMACGFDFEKVYGEYGKGFIEVHHAKPLFENDKEITPDPVTDLICLCPNCHRMIHHFKNKVLTLDELKEIIKENREL